MQENELIKRCRQNDRIAQELLFKKYGDQLFHLAFRYLRNHDQAQDVMIVSFNRIFSHISDFKAEGAHSFRAWLKKIVINEALTQLRKRNNFNLTEALDAAVSEPFLDTSNCDLEFLLCAIAGLPAGYRTVFNLYEVEGYSHDEIAAMLDISPNTSRSQLFKAKSLLRKIITHEFSEYGT